jgi:hypothetical protein
MQIVSFVSDGSLPDTLLANGVSDDPASPDDEASPGLRTRGVDALSVHAAGIGCFG